MNLIMTLLCAFFKFDFFKLLLFANTKTSILDFNLWTGCLRRNVKHAAEENWWYEEDPSSMWRNYSPQKQFYGNKIAVVICSSPTKDFIILFCCGILNFSSLPWYISHPFSTFLVWAIFATLFSVLLSGVRRNETQWDACNGNHDLYW